MARMQSSPCLDVNSDTLPAESQIKQGEVDIQSVQRAQRSAAFDTAQSTSAPSSQPSSSPIDQALARLGNEKPSAGIMQDLKIVAEARGLSRVDFVRVKATLLRVISGKGEYSTRVEAGKTLQEVLSSQAKTASADREYQCAHTAAYRELTDALKSLEDDLTKAIEAEVKNNPKAEESMPDSKTLEELKQRELEVLAMRAEVSRDRIRNVGASIGTTTQPTTSTNANPTREILRPIISAQSYGTFASPDEIKSAGNLENLSVNDLEMVRFGLLHHVLKADSPLRLDAAEALEKVLKQNASEQRGSDFRYVRHKGYDGLTASLSRIQPNNANEEFRILAIRARVSANKIKDLDIPEKKP